MDARELCDKLNHTGMERAARRLALANNLASEEEIAGMSKIEVCDLIAAKYEMVYTESEEIWLVKKENVPELNKLIKCISR